MRVVEIKKIAKEIGVETNKLNKAALIRAIQKKEGNQDCYNSDNYQCAETECCWRDDCLVS